SRSSSLSTFFSFFFSSVLPLRYLHSFPTRRSSDLASFVWWIHRIQGSGVCGLAVSAALAAEVVCRLRPSIRLLSCGNRNKTMMRSEEHTSELQSRGHLVCRLLLEKKKKKTK